MPIPPLKRWASVLGKRPGMASLCAAAATYAQRASYRHEDATHISLPVHDHHMPRAVRGSEAKQAACTWGFAGKK